jgi:hypothetical protein
LAEPELFMANQDQLTAQIAFALSRMSARNAHHDFEHLCREVARERIAINILPATGPVAGSGDQGRDFETFRSHLANELGEHGGFVGQTISKDALAFTCTLQAENIRAKIRSDIEKIVGGGEPVRGIYAFVASPVKVGDRHAWIQEVKDDFGVELIIFDSEALAEHLARPDLFEAAQTYLSIPYELAPLPVEEERFPEWYSDALERWRKHETLPATTGAFLDLRGAIRHATFDKSARAEISFWIERMRQFGQDTSNDQLKQQARYEVAVASLRGLGDLRPAEDLVEEFFSLISSDTDPEHFHDAAILLTYVLAAIAAGETNLELERVVQWRDGLRERVRSLIDATAIVGDQARLLETDGWLAAQIDVARLEPRLESASIPDPADLVDREGKVRTEDFVAPPPEELVDAAGAVVAWSRLVELLDRAPLYPLDSFAQVVALFTPTLVDQPGWRKLVTGLDAALARQAGQSAAAAKCRDRAMALLGADRFREALQEFHQAKLDWWSGDTLRGSLLASLLVAHCYLRLNLPQAAKQHALIAAGVASSSRDESVSDLISQAFVLAARADYEVGAWCGSTEWTEMALRTASEFGEGGADLSNEETTAAIYHQAMVRQAAEELVPELLPPIAEFMDGTGMGELVAEAGGLEPIGRDAWLKRADQELMGRPFSDTGEEHVVRFAALGTRWTIHGRNNYDERRAVERLGAAAQILLVEVAEEDLCFIPTELDVEVTLRDPGNEREPDVGLRLVEGRRCFRVTLTRDVPPESNLIELLATLTVLLLDASLRPQAEYEEAIRRAFERGLGHKLAFARPFDDLATLISKERFELSNRRAVDPPFAVDGTPWRSSEHLGWQSGPGPGYSPQLGQEQASNRYEAAKSVQLTLKTLGAEADFQATLAELRERGWLDWHVLTSILNIVINRRLAERGLDTFETFRNPEAVEEVERVMKGPEDPGSLAPASAFTLEAMERARRFSIAATLKNWGLELRQAAPDFVAIDSFLRERYGYWSDDVEHAELFRDHA